MGSDPSGPLLHRALFHSELDTGASSAAQKRPSGAGSLSITPEVFRNANSQTPLNHTEQKLEAWAPPSEVQQAPHVFKTLSDV